MPEYFKIPARVCGKLKFGSDSDIKNPNWIWTIQKFDIHADGFLTETVCNPQFKLKVIKITLLAFYVQIKNVLKHDRNWVEPIDFRTQLYYLIVVSDVKVN